MQAGELTLRWTFVASTLGYTGVVVIALALGLETRPFALAMRAAVAALCVLGSMYFMYRRIPATIPVALFSFLILFLVRMISDQGRFESAAEDLLYYVAATLAPVVLFALMAALWNDRKSAETMYKVGSFVCVMLILADVLNFSGWRSATEFSSGRFSYDVLDPITVGNVGAMTVVGALAALNYVRRVWALVAIGVGVVVVGLSLSRGPTVSLAISIAFFLWSTGRTKILLALASGAVFIFLGEQFGQVAESLRLDDLGQDASSAARVQVVWWSINLIAEHPITGFAYLEPVTQYYPHNLFVESGLALGVGGVALILYICGNSFIKGMVHLRRGELFSYMVAVYWIVEAQFSGAIWSNVMLWLAFIVLARNYVFVGAASSQRWSGLRSGGYRT